MRFTKQYVNGPPGKRWVKVNYTYADFKDVKKIALGAYRCIDKDDNCLILKIQ